MIYPLCLPCVVRCVSAAAKGRTNLELRSEQLLRHAPGAANGAGMTDMMTGFSPRRRTPAPALAPPPDQPLTLDLLAAGLLDTSAHCSISPRANPHTHVAVIDHLDEMPHSAAVQAAVQQLGLPLNPVVKVCVVWCLHAMCIMFCAFSDCCTFLIVFDFGLCPRASFDGSL